MKPVEVLLVEDEPGDALLANQVIADCTLPVTLHIAHDGEEALAVLSNRDLKLDLVILDLNLPKISGHEVLERRLVKDVPVVVFSSSWRDSDAQRALALGACEYVEKPMDIQAYSDTVCGMIEKWAVRRDDKAEAMNRHGDLV